MKNHLKMVSILANLLDNQFEIAGLRFGLSAVIDLIPGVGDTIDAILSLYVVWIAWKVEVPPFIIARMVGNIGLNFVIGLIPVVGDSIYLLRQVNMKNLRLLQRYVPQTIIEGEIVS